MTTPKSLSAFTLRDWILLKKPTAPERVPSPPIPKNFKIVDVRDDDFQGGYIPGTINVPSRSFLLQVDSLVEELKNHDAVVFTCALSQQRGPHVSPWHAL